MIIEPKLIVEAMVGDSDRNNRVYGRLLATGFIELLEKWVESERKAGSTPPDVLMALPRALSYYLGDMLAAVALCGHEVEAGEKFMEALREMTIDNIKSTLEAIQGTEESLMKNLKSAPDFVRAGIMRLSPEDRKMAIIKFLSGRVDHANIIVTDDPNDPRLVDAPLTEEERRTGKAIRFVDKRTGKVMSAPDQTPK